jgi:miniconductance mechanosensitive channel
MPKKYITAHSYNENMTNGRQLESTSKRITLEIYCFTYEREWVKYESCSIYI